MPRCLCYRIFCCGLWPKTSRSYSDDFFVLVPAVDYSREEFAQTLAVVGSVRGRAPVVADEKHIACVEVGACMDISLYSSTPNFASKGTLQVHTKYSFSVNLSKLESGYIPGRLHGEAGEAVEAG